MELSYFGKVRQEGEHLILLEMLQAKFRELPPIAIDQVRTIESQEELAVLVTKVSAQFTREKGLAEVMGEVMDATRGNFGL